MIHENEKRPAQAQPEPSNVRVQLGGTLADNLKGEYQVLAELWAMDSTVYVVVDEVVYRVFALDHWRAHADAEVTVVSYDPTDGDWLQSTRDAMTLGVEWALALTKVAIG